MLSFEERETKIKSIQLPIKEILIHKKTKPPYIKDIQGGFCLGFC